MTGLRPDWCELALIVNPLTVRVVDHAPVLLRLNDAAPNPHTVARCGRQQLFNCVLGRLLVFALLKCVPALYGGACPNGALTPLPLSAFIFLGIAALQSSPRTLLYNYVACLIVTTSALAYLVMALGNSEILNGLCNREFIWVRYADWAVTGPLSLTLLGFIAGADYADIVFVVACSLLSTAAYFAGATSPGWGGPDVPWPLFAFGSTAALPIVAVLLKRWAVLAYERGAATFRLYATLAGLWVLCWVGYVLIWATGEGAQLASVDEETIAYAALDIVARCVWCFVLVFSHDALEEVDAVADVSSAKAAAAREGGGMQQV